MELNQIIAEFKKLENKTNFEQKQKFGINPTNGYGLSNAQLKVIAKKIGKNHKLALELWDSEIHEARILAGYIDIPEKVSKSQMNKWVKDFNSWDVCDNICGNLFCLHTSAIDKVFEWTSKKEEFIKRAGFVIIACMAVHRKELTNEDFEQFSSIIKKESIDERNFVKKAVNWALRQIGKRNLSLNKKAVKLAKEIEKIDSKSARWIAKDAIRELTDEKTLERIKKKKK